MAPVRSWLALASALALSFTVAEAHAQWAPVAPDEPPPVSPYATPRVAPERTVIKGLVIAGGSVLGSSFGLGLLGAVSSKFSNQSGWMLLPVAGPWVTLAARERDNCKNSTGEFCGLGDAMVDIALVGVGFAQLTGAVLLTVGLHGREKAPESSLPYVTPWATSSGGGLAASGSF